MHADDTNITARSSSLSNVEDSLNELENIHHANGFFQTN
jgi:hypothetical protein